MLREFEIKPMLVKTLEEDFEVAPGITFNELIDAAMNGNGDFVLNPPGVDGKISLPNKQWLKLYDLLLDTDDDDTVYTDDEWGEYLNTEKQFIKRYKSV